MAARQFIGTFMRRAEEAYLEGNGSRGSVNETFNAVADTATRQVLRGMIRDGFISEDRAKSRKTAKRIDTNKIGSKDIPQCPPGYAFDRKKMDCLPMTQNDRIDGKLNSNTGGGAHYNVWGRTGLNGDGYAYEEPAGMDINATHWDSLVHEAKRIGFCFECRKPSDKCVCARGYRGSKQASRRTDAVYEAENQQSFCFECRNPAEKCNCGCDKEGKKQRRPRSRS